MQQPRETDSEQPGLPDCWLCGNAVLATEAEELLIDDAYQVLHQDCSEQVKKSANV